MQKSLMELFGILLIFVFAISSSYSPAIAATIKKSNSEIVIFYKDEKQTSKDKSLLSQGDVLLTGTNIQISITGLDVGSYSLLMDRDGNEKTILNKEPIKIDKATKVLIPSADKWLKISNNSGGYKLIVYDTNNGKIATEFYFTVLPSTTNDRSSPNSLAINSKQSQIDIFSLPAMYLDKTTNVFTYLKKNTSNSYIPRTRGTGSSIFKAYASAVPLVIAVRGKKFQQIGSGIILNNRGDIITNHHVVAGADALKVTLRNQKNKILYKAKLKHCDPSRDLAHIKLNIVPPDIQVVKMGSNNDGEVGDDVHAIGHPKGELWSYSKGPIGQIRPDYTWKMKGNKYKATLIQTGATINPGNSGGPLITDQGKVIGINTWSRLQAQGINFAVSVDDIKKFFQNRSSFPCENKLVRDKQIKPKILEIVDLDNDKNPEKIVFDSNGDGKKDFLYFDINSDGNFEYILKDDNHDNYFETKITQEPSMKRYIFRRDVDKDGVFDEIGYDTNMDFKPDKTVKIIG